MTIKKIFFLIILPLGCYIGFIFATNPIKSPPYPYRFISKMELVKSERPHLLILGDQLGKSLMNYQETLSNQLSANLNTPLIIHNIAEDKEGMHRTLRKIKSMAKLPKVLLYYGGSQELSEEILNIEYLDDILINLKRYQDDRIRELLEIVPELSKFIFNPIPLIPLEKEVRTRKKEIKNEKDIMKILEISFILYEIQLEEFIKVSKSKNSNLIIVTPPINLELFPKKVCPLTSSEKIILLQEYAFELIAQKNYSEAIKELTALLKLMPANALTHHLLGKSYIAIGEQEKGIDHLEKAVAFDCSLLRASAPIIISIQRKLADKYDLMIIDYHAMMSGMVGKNTLFLDDFFPQSLFDEKIVSTLIIPIRKYLKL